ncbi:MAG: flavodoxin-dependent (E)-4-hydroxy-3-methylbut-2-enyl-diphosphate synthase [bacterium]
MNRNKTRQIKVGNLLLGNNDKVYIQSMTNTKTKDIFSTVKQIKQLEKYGCEIVRVAVLDMEDAKAISFIKKEINIPLVCDIHFDYKLAIECINNGCDKIRLNPGNISNIDHVKEVVCLCKEKSIPIRIGVNSGSLPKDLEVNAESMIIAAKRHIAILEELDFYDICLSLKASSVKLTIEAYELASKEFSYPLHLGVTESGTSFGGLIKSSIGIGNLLINGIGNTIRVSLTDDPYKEIIAAKQILNNIGLYENTFSLTSCPTCGRLQYSMVDIAKEIELFLEENNKKIHVAVMGCAVNGPGEAREADIGIAGGVDSALLFKKGEIIKKIPQDKILEVLKEEILNF